VGSGAFFGRGINLETKQKITGTVFRAKEGTRTAACVSLLLGICCDYVDMLKHPMDSEIILFCDKDGLAVKKALNIEIVDKYAIQLGSDGLEIHKDALT
jgi:hypothetical protein